MPKDMRNTNTICLNCFSTLDKSGFCFKCRTRANDYAGGSLLTLPLRTVLSGRYLISKPLGTGGFGITYLGWDLMESKRVAIKEFFPKGYTTRQQFSTKVTVLRQEYVSAFNHWLNAFIQEARILLSINHLHGVVKLLDFFEANNTAYIVMDYLEGQNLRKYLIARGGRIPIREALSVLRPVFASFVVMHQYGVIHKDISPENIQIVQNRYVKLIDFGAATIYNREQNLTSKPYIVLKPGYSPPEMYNANLQQGPWSDIYEMGATLYNCITGLIPPEAPLRMQQDYLPRPTQLGVRVPIPVENAIMKSLMLRPEQRYDNIGDFMQMLYGDFMPRPYPKTRKEV